MGKIKGGKCHPGVRRYGTNTRYSEEKLNRVLQDITNGVISERTASKTYGIPRNTLRNKRFGKHSKNVGRPTVFSEEEEGALVNQILVLGDMGMPVSLYDLRCIVKCYLDNQGKKVDRFQNNFPGWDWSQLFFKRHIEMIKHTFEKTIAIKRVRVNEDTITNFFDHIELETKHVPSSNIYNYDETGFHDNPGKKKLLFRRLSRNPERIKNATKSCYTVMFCGNADGELIPPYIIMKGAQKWTDWVAGAPFGTRLNVSKSGWIETQVFEDWFENHFLLAVKRKAGRKVLIGDNMSAHISIKCLKLAKQNNVSFIFLPPNSTHLLQPLDVGYFSSLKSNWWKVLSKWRATIHGKKCVNLPKGMFSQLLKAALEAGESTATHNLSKGFKSTGIHPSDREKVLTKLPSYAKSIQKINECIGLEFKNYIETVRTNELQNVSRPRKFCVPVVPGKSVSVEEVETFLNKKEEEERIKKERARVKCGARVRTRGGRQRAPGGPIRTLSAVTKAKLKIFKFSKTTVDSTVNESELVVEIAGKERECEEHLEEIEVDLGEIEIEAAVDANDLSGDNDMIFIYDS